VLAAAGFDAVEFQRLGPGDADRHAPYLRRFGLAVALVNLDIGDFATGGPGIAGAPARADEFAAALKEGYRNARALGARIANVGPARVLPDMQRETCLAQLRDNLMRARDLLSPHGIAVSIEALNSRDYPDLLIRNPDEAWEVIEELDDPRIVLQYDIYHAAIDDRDVNADLARFAPRLGHVQFADAPGRHQPGTGCLELDENFSKLASGGYQGFVGAEYFPSGSYDASLDWLARYRSHRPTTYIDRKGP
jgi:hydroxypyruvate isomerase